MWNRRKLYGLLFLLGGLVVLVGLPFVYVLNFSHEFRAGGLIPVAHWRFLPASAYPDGTLQTISRAAMLAAALWIAALLPHRPRKVLAGLMLTGAGLITLMTLHHRLVPRSAYDWSWLFVNRNQFAAFACLMFPVALTGGARSQYRAFLGGRLSNPSGLWYLLAGLLAVSVIQTGSRAAIGILILQTMGYIGIQWRIRRDHPFVIPPLTPWRKILLGGILAMAVGFGTVSLIRNQPVLQAAGGDFYFRGVVRNDTWSMWRSRKWWGTGPGTFATVFPYYQTLPVDQYYFRHAHCEPLQFLAEFGILGGCLIMLGVAFILKGAGRVTGCSGQLPSFRELEGRGLWLALGGVFLHGLVDFPFRHPLILLVCGIWVGMLARGYGWSGIRTKSAFRR